MSGRHATCMLVCVSGEAPLCCLPADLTVRPRSSRPPPRSAACLQGSLTPQLFSCRPTLARPAPQLLGGGVLDAGGHHPTAPSLAFNSWCCPTAGRVWRTDELSPSANFPSTSSAFDSRPQSKYPCPEAALWRWCCRASSTIRACAAACCGGAAGAPCTGDGSVPGSLQTLRSIFTGSHATSCDYGDGRCGARPGQRRRGSWQPRISMQADKGSFYGVCSPQAAAAAAAARRARWCVLLRRPVVALSILCCKPHWL